MKPRVKEHLFAKLVNELTPTARVTSDTCKQLQGNDSKDLKKYIEQAAVGDENDLWTAGHPSAVRLIGQLVILG